MDKRQITYPVIAVSRRNSFSVVRDAERLSRCSLLGIVKGYFDDLILYDAAGFAWQVTEVVPAISVTPMKRWQARFLYNPRTTVTLHYAEPRRYELDEVRSDLARLIDSDPDDLYDQFVTHEELKRLLARAESPYEVIRVAETLGFEEAESESGQLTIG